MPQELVSFIFNASCNGQTLAFEKEKIKIDQDVTWEFPLELDAIIDVCSVNAASDFIINNGVESDKSKLDHVSLLLPQLCKQLKKINFSFKYRIEGGTEL